MAQRTKSSGTRSSSSRSSSRNASSRTKASSRSRRGSDPNAPHGQPFILLERASPYGPGSKIASLLGYLDFGKVTALEALPAAAGE